MRWVGTTSARRLAPYGWFLVLALVVLGPILLPGYLLLLDAPAGPREPWPSWVPLPSEGLTSAAGAAGGDILRFVALISSQLPNKLLILASVLVGGWGLFRFAKRSLGVSPVASVAAGTFFVINPWLLDRFMAGQLRLTLGYAVLPWALPTLLRIVRTGDRRDVLAGIGWVALMAPIDLHMVGLAFLLILFAVCFSPASWGARAVDLALSVAGVALVNAYWILPPLLTGEEGALGKGDFLAYAPLPHSAGVLGNVLVLHGFWREEFQSPLAQNPALFLSTFVPIVAVAGLGVAVAVRSAWRRPAAALGCSCLLALVLGMGPSFFPTAGFSRFLFEHLPGYGIFREPQKWIGLLALGYAVFLGPGLDRLLRFRPTRESVAVGGLFLPLIASHIMLLGFDGRVHVSTFPAGWERAAQAIGDQQGRLLFLPWNQYQPLPFAGDRVILNPGQNYFGSRTLVSENPALDIRHQTKPADPRTTYVARLIRHSASVERFGHLVAPLGVRYVALAQIADASAYGFLQRQTDLRLVFRDDGIDLYQNLAWRGSSYGLAGGGPSSLPDLLHRPSSVQDDASSRLSSWPGPVEQDPFEVNLRWLPGWRVVPRVEEQYVGTDAACSDGWRLGDEVPVCHLGALAAFEGPAGQEKLWRPQLALQVVGYAITVAALSVLFLLARRGRRAQKEKAPVSGGLFVS